MPEKIHYEDNIFILISLVRVLNDTIRLNVDAEYFVQKFVEEASFVDSTLEKLYESLQNNNQLIKRDLYLHLIMKLKYALGRLLDDVFSTSNDIVTALQSHQQKLRRIAARHLTDAETIRRSLSKPSGQQTHKDVISYDELFYLMSPMEESHEA